MEFIFISCKKHVTEIEDNITDFGCLIVYYKPDQSIFTTAFHQQCSRQRFTFAAFQLRSLGILPFGASNTITAAVTFVTAPGGDPNDFSSVKLPWGQTKEADYYIFTSFIITIH
jgi:hypothetical protein